MGEGETVTRNASQSTRRTRGPRGPAAVAGGLVLGLLKAHALTVALDTHAGPIVLCSLLLVSAILRLRPAWAAVSAAALVAFIDRPGSWLAGAGLGAGLCAVLLVLCFLISTALHARQRRDTGMW